MVATARQAIAHNGLQQHIKVVQKRSDELVVCTSQSSCCSGPDASPVPLEQTKHARGRCCQPTPEWDLPQRVDVIVTEIFDSELLGEGILPTLQHAVNNLLKVHALQSNNNVLAQAECRRALQCRRIVLPAMLNNGLC